jgi:hypothetical protein
MDMDITTIFRKYAPAYIEKFQDRIPIEHQRAIYDICNCRTDALGGHLDYCDNCGRSHFFNHSCYNRSCPQCQGIHSKKWLDKQIDKLLPVPYFHIVFTVPKEVGDLIRQYPAQLLNTLFDAVNISLKQVIKYSKYGNGNGNGDVTLAALCVLHTWNRQLGYHPHIHCLIPGVLIYKPPSGNWRFKFTKKKFFAPVQALSDIFRAVFVRLTRKEIPHLKFPQSIFKKDWVVYSRPTFKYAKKVLQYLSLYIYRTAISNSRIVSVRNSKITFSYKDSTTHRQHYMTLDSQEFLRRFLQHTLPPGFHKVRFFGFFSPSYKKILSSLRFELHKLNYYGSGDKGGFSQKGKYDCPRICPYCKIGILRTIGHIYFRKKFLFINRAPPHEKNKS